MKSNFEAIVAGCGGVGSAALYHLARRGVRVLGIDRFAPPHDRGSSHGRTRIIRRAYFEHPDYVPLANASVAAWDELAADTGEVLGRTTGLVEFGPADGVVVPGVLKAAREHGLLVSEVHAVDAKRRWPGLDASGLAGVFEPDAGVLFVERCVAAHLRAARERGAETLFDADVLDWTPGKAITVRTAKGEFQTERLIIAAGPWASAVLHDLRIPLPVHRQVVTWHAAAPEARADAGCPCFLFELPEGVFYGFPDLDGGGVKVGDHAPGDRVDDPISVDRTLRETDVRPLARFLAERLPRTDPQPSRHSVCLYTMSPDEHFIVDHSPADGRIVFAAGLSGHGFKFAPVLGETLADLAIDGTTRLPVGFLSLKRFMATG